MAAKIESALKIKATLVEGHNGIYEISTENEVVYTNQGKCSQGFPDDEEIIDQIGRIIGVNAANDQAPACALTGEGKHDANKDQESNMILTNSDCGCGSGDSISSSGAGCCGPNTDSPSGSGCCDTQDSISGKKKGSIFRIFLSGIIIITALALAGFSVAKKAGWYGNVDDQASSAGLASADRSVAVCATTPTQDSLLIELVGEHDAVFALLPCGHEDHTQELYDDVLPTISKLKEEGKRVDLIVIDPSTPTYTSLIELNAAESFPCLAVIGTSCSPSLLSDDYTEERLFTAFVAATSPVYSSCSTPCGVPSTDSTFTATSCCPK